MKLAREIIAIAEADRGADLGNAERLAAEDLRGFADAEADQVIDRRATHEMPEKTEETALGHAREFGEIVDR